MFDFLKKEIQRISPSKEQLYSVPDYQIPPYIAALQAFVSMPIIVAVKDLNGMVFYGGKKPKGLKMFMASAYDHVSGKDCIIVCKKFTKLSKKEQQALLDVQLFTMYASAEDLATVAQSLAINLDGMSSYDQVINAAVLMSMSIRKPKCVKKALTKRDAFVRKEQYKTGKVVHKYAATLSQQMSGEQAAVNPFMEEQQTEADQSMPAPASVPTPAEA